MDYFGKFVVEGLSPFLHGATSADPIAWVSLAIVPMWVRTKAAGAPGHLSMPALKPMFNWRNLLRHLESYVVRAPVERTRIINARFRSDEVENNHIFMTLGQAKLTHTTAVHGPDLTGHKLCFF